MSDTLEPNDETLLQPEDESHPSSRFRIVRCLGSGGMGDVHLAEDSSLRRMVAIKTIRGELCQDEEIRKRIERECLLHARIGSHPHIVTLFDRIEERGRIQLVMEYVEGETLQALLERYAGDGKRLSLHDSIAIVCQTLDALSRIHALGIVHRDIKPSNLLLARDDEGEYSAKLMDFGIARPSDDGMTALTMEGSGGPGTPLYMAPEQIDPKTYGEVSAATDVYATGVMLYQMVSGRPPFTGSLTEIFNGHLNCPPPPLEVERSGIPNDLVEVLAQSLAKRTGERYQNARALRDDLLRVGGLSADRDPSRTLPSVGLESGRTLTASEAMAIQSGPGATMLDSGTAHRATARASGGRLLTVLGAAAAVTVVCAGAYFGYGAFSSRIDDSVSPAPSSPTEQPANTVPTTAESGGSAELGAAPEQPVADTAVVAGPESTLAPLPQDAAAALPPSGSDEPVAADASAGGASAMEELLRRRGSDGDNAAETAARPDGGEPAATAQAEAEPEPDPEPEPEPKPKPKPKPKPTPPKEEPKPEEAQAAGEDAKPTNANVWDNVKIIRVEDRKVE